MKVITVNCLSDNFSYIVINEKNNNACVIDPGEADPIINIVTKNKINIKYILNTHHHEDHVGGNLELKKKFNCNVLGFVDDKNYIPGIDTFLKDKELYKDKDFEFMTYHTPGHTLGHVVFHFHKYNFLFSGDTLFSLGCGRIFEGTHDQMFNSLKIIKKLSKDTMIYFGHEYTKSNLNFCLFNDPNNIQLKNKVKKIHQLIDAGKPTTPTSLIDELQTNIFLKSENLETFKKLRDLKDNF